jgi:hypothetical protein
MLSGKCESWSLEPPQPEELQPPAGCSVDCPITFNSITSPPDLDPCGLTSIYGGCDASRVPPLPDCYNILFLIIIYNQDQSKCRIEYRLLKGACRIHYNENNNDRMKL